MRMRGPSKEHRSDLPLVSIALVIDKNGFPMDFEVFKGNSSEYRTMESTIRKLKDKYTMPLLLPTEDSIQLKIC